MSFTDPTAFIEKWQKSGASERANYQLFLAELCDLLGVPRPDPAGPDDQDNAYVFERAVTFTDGDIRTTGFIDLYKRGCFVLECKQGMERRQQEEPLSERFRKRLEKLRSGTVRGTRGWDLLMENAFSQARSYVSALPSSEGRPPFIVVVDVGFSFELYSEFSRSGGQYQKYPDPQNFRILLTDLVRAENLDLLRALFTEPMSLDRSAIAARVTRQVADRLAKLAKSLEESGHAADVVAGFLERILFTMFAEDVKLLEEGVFTDLLKGCRELPEIFPERVTSLWETMRDGGRNIVIARRVPRFNGFLFEETAALPVNADQLELLIEAAAADWSAVEPAIFGTLLERALDPRVRHKLGAHYTPRAYVLRLVEPTVMAPLREEWQAVRLAALDLVASDKAVEARARVREFHRTLCGTQILDPACGSGNFLYVTLEQMKHLEAEILDFYTSLHGGADQGIMEEMGATVSPEQFHGLEVNPRARAIAELVLWIGYLQQQLRLRREIATAEPIVRAFDNIKLQDAVLTWDAVEEEKDADGKPVTRWDGITTKTHPVTGKQVPDDSARVPVYRYINPRPAEWPRADYVVGNPPFVGNARMREVLGDGYVEALRATHPDVPESCDYVMYWWNHAAELARNGAIRRFGFIATNSLRQTFNRRVLQLHLEADPPLSIVFAIPDHPWVDSADGAAVRISMTVGKPGRRPGSLLNILWEEKSDKPESHIETSILNGFINSDITLGSDLSRSTSLESNCGISSRGVVLHGPGFIVSKEVASTLGLGNSEDIKRHIRVYRNGKDITDRPRNVMVIDLFGSTPEDISQIYPALYQHVLNHVKPERDSNRDEWIRTNWWIYGRPRPELRNALIGLPRYISTVETAKHRFFVFLDAEVLPDNMLVNIACSDAWILGILSSRFHVAWALAQGGTLEDRPRYNKTRCFETFPFPAATEEQKARIRDLGERLDAHRKRQQEQHPKLTLTGMYNVLEKLRAGEALTEKERVIHEQGLVTVLKQIHDELDIAVAAAYGWPADLPEGEVLARLAALNAERTQEEKNGLVRWLRPEYQNPAGPRATQQSMAGLETPQKTAAAPAAPTPWPADPVAQAAAVRASLQSLGAPADAETIARTFRNARADRVREILETAVALGAARRLPDGRYSFN